MNPALSWQPIRPQGQPREGRKLLHGVPGITRALTLKGLGATLAFGSTATAFEHPDFACPTGL